jgi:HEPN domain-containing protein
MNQNLKSLTDQIVSLVEPKKMIIFQLRTNGNNTNNTNHVLLLAVEESLMNRDTLKNLYMNINGITISYDIILMSEEFLTKKSKDGFIINDSNYEIGIDDFDLKFSLSPENWFHHAVQYLMAGKGGDRSKNSKDFLCYNLLISVKMVLQGLLRFHGLKMHYTHNLKALLEELKNSQFIELPDFFDSLPILNCYAVTSSYQLEFEEISEREFEDAIQLADHACQWLRNHVE